MTFSLIFTLSTVFPLTLPSQTTKPPTVLYYNPSHTHHPLTPPVPHITMSFDGNFEFLASSPSLAFLSEIDLQGIEPAPISLPRPAVQSNRGAIQHSMQVRKRSRRNSTI